jgi:hypothetical protein
MVDRGGTSVSSPALAGVVNVAGHFATSSENELTTIYSNLGNSADFHDIALEYCGPFAGFTGKAGWDFCTGVGSVRISTTARKYTWSIMPARLHHECAGGHLS